MELRDLPSIDALAGDLDTGEFPRVVVIEAARRAVEGCRSRLIAGEATDPPEVTARAELARLRNGRPQSVVNATGVLLHTNLGRAPQDPAAATAAQAAATTYGSIEFDLDSGRRGSRAAYLHQLAADLVDAEAALVVNNNAAALFLALAALARERSVPVSRGELIEIGGSYRLPDLMAATGAHLVEIGTTNRTRIGDYEAAITDATAMLLKVHPSNYRVMGFTEEVTTPELAELARNRGLPLVFDVGSGLLDENVPWLPGAPPSWLKGEPGVRQALAEGADLVMFSGDKLLGGPQAGIIAGRAELVAALKRYPIARALRIDGGTLASLTATLERYADGTAGTLPFWEMVQRPTAGLIDRLAAIAHSAGVPSDIRQSSAMPGAGSVPGMVIPSPALAITRVAADDLFRRLLDDGIVTRRDAGTVLIDVRAVDPADDERIARVLADACRS